MTAGTPAEGSIFFERFASGCRSTGGANERLIRPLCCPVAVLGKPYKREMAERRCGAPLSEPHAGGAFCPGGLALEREFGAPAELLRGRGEPLLPRLAHPRFRADTPGQNRFT